MYDIQIEHQLLAALMVSGDITGTVADINGHVIADDFYDQQSKEMYERILELVDDGQEVNPVTLMTKNLSLDFIADISVLGISSHIAVGLADKVAKQSETRNLYLTAQQIMTYLANGEDVELVRTNLIDYLSDGKRDAFDTTKHISEAVTPTLENIAEQRGQEGVPGITTGFKTIDNEIGGLLESSLTIIGARPAMGKTAFALNMAEGAARLAKKPVLVISLEMSNDMLVKRMLSTRSLVDADKIRDSRLTEQEFSDLSYNAEKLSELPIWFDDTPIQSFTDIRSRVLKLKRQQGELGMVLIDYLGLVETGNEKNSSRVNEVSKISRGLKILSKEIKAPVVALAQLNRGVEQRTDKRPLLSDLRDSGSIEQDADNVAFLYRDDYYRNEGEEAQNDDEISQVEFIVAKNRNGKRGTVPLSFDKKHNLMTDWRPSYQSPNTDQGW